MIHIFKIINWYDTCVFKSFTFMIVSKQILFPNLHLKVGRTGSSQIEWISSTRQNIQQEHAFHDKHRDATSSQANTSRTTFIKLIIF